MPTLDGKTSTALCRGAVHPSLVGATPCRRQSRGRCVPCLLALVPQPPGSPARRDVTVEPTPDAPETDNPYISYNGVRVTERGAVVGNGSHVDPIAEKLELGYPARDAIAEPLLSLDFEKDDYDTPRVAGIVGVDAADPTTNADGPGAVIGTVRRDALLVEEVTEPTLVATYEENSPTAFDLAATDAATWPAKCTTTSTSTPSVRPASRGRRASSTWPCTTGSERMPRPRRTQILS